MSGDDSLVEDRREDGADLSGEASFDDDRRLDGFFGLSWFSVPSTIASTSFLSPFLLTDLRFSSNVFLTFFGSSSTLFSSIGIFSSGFGFS